MKRKIEEQFVEKLNKKRCIIKPIQDPDFNNKSLEWYLVLSEELEEYFNSFEDAKDFALIKKSEGIKYMHICKLFISHESCVDSFLIKNYITYKTIEEIR
jgi:hypothetical protein